MGARRASHACVKCRMRKVRCDVAIRGTPCMNCSLDGNKCEVKILSRGRGRNSAQSHEVPRRSVRPSMMSSVCLEDERDDESIYLRGCKEKDLRSELGVQAEGIDTNSLPCPGITMGHHRHVQVRGTHDNGPKESCGSCLTPSPSPDRGEQRTDTGPVTLSHAKRHEEQKGAAGGGLSRGEHAVCSPNYIGYSYYQFLTVNNISSMLAQDYRYLELQGCLQVPVRRILDVFVREYFLHMHPMLPILDEGAFWDIYDQRSGVSESDSKISLLLFQTMLFACCNFVPQSILRQIGQTTARSARATFYRRAKLLFDLEVESSSLIKSQAALLLASWSFSSYEIPRKPTIPWLVIAVQSARDVDAHNYEAFSIHSEDYAVRKRLWWGCIIRDCLFGLGMRRGTYINPAQFAITCSSRLGYYDLIGEVHRSTVHPVAVKVQLAEILERLVELCIVLIDILELAFPVDGSLKQARDGPDLRRRVRNCQVALRKWYEETIVRLPNQVAMAEEAKHHGSVVLYVNLIYMYYHSTKITLGHYEVLQIATAAISSPPSSANIAALQDNHLALQNAVLGTTRCLEQLTYLQLVKWLPITAVSCTALPLLLHVLGTEISSSGHLKDSNHASLMKHRLKILQKAMETYQFQYEGVSWIRGAIDRVVTLFRARADSNTWSSGAHVSPQNSISGEGRAEMLMFQPGWYLRLAFTVDMALSKGRLPEGHNFIRSFRELILAEIGHSQNDSKQMQGEGRVYTADAWPAKRRTTDQSAVLAAASSGRVQMVTEPSYVITEAKNSVEEMLLFKDLDPDGMEKSMGDSHRSESRSNSSRVEDLTVEEEDAASERDMLTLFSHEALDGNGDFPVSFLSLA